MTSGVEDMRKQLSEYSVELEDIKENNKKKLAFQEKNIEETYSELNQYNQ